jgi:polyisoprenyl-teichoic acid--peptidoglycan teichoic acid transferase
VRPRDVEPPTRPVPKAAPDPRRQPDQRLGAAEPPAGRTATPRSPGGRPPAVAPARRDPTRDDPDATAATTRTAARTPATDRPSTDRGSAARTSAANGSTPRRSVTRSGPGEGDGEQGATDLRRRGPRRTLGRALIATAASTVAPGSGHLILRRTRTGALILGGFLLVIIGIAVFVLNADRAQLLQTALSGNVLVMAAIGCVVAALAWIAVIVRTYLVGRPRRLAKGKQAAGIAVVTALCLVVAAPFGFAANLANSQRNLLSSLFGGGGGTSAAEAISKPRLNVLLIGSDAGPDRTGARTDTMMVASVDTKTGRTVLFSLPRNIGYAQFPPGSPMAKEFPNGFHDNADPLSGNYLLNAVYAWGRDHPQLTPDTPTQDPGMNLLHQTISYMLGLQLDYYVEVNMAGFASIIDALGGLTMDVGPEPLPIGGITPSGRHVEPDGYVPAGVQQLSGEQALAVARSRTDSSDYTRMGRQRCLLQNILVQKSPADMLSNFQGVAAATTNSVSTNIPQEVLPALATLASGQGGISLESVAFDPSLPDPEEDDGNFNTGRPNFPYMRQVVQDAINRPAPPPATSPAAAPTASDEAGSDDTGSDDTGSDDTGSGSSGSDDGGSTSGSAAPSAQPTSLAASCG